MESLTTEEKKLLGFSIFSTAMKMGPTQFSKVEEIAKKIGVLEEMSHYATDWIGYSQKNKDAIEIPPELQPEIPEKVTIGNTMVATFDKNGQQMPGLQFSCLELVFREFEKRGIDPVKIPEIKAVINGALFIIFPFRVGKDWNMKIEKDKV